MNTTAIGAATPFVNTGGGPLLVPLEIGHPSHMAVVDPDTAYWAIVRKDRLADLLTGSNVVQDYRQRMEECATEMDQLRFGLKPSAVYFNPTDRCNLDCSYCYIPRDMRRGGEHMTETRLLESLGLLRDYFSRHMPRGRRPRVIFHGAEPLLNFKAVRAGIHAFKDEFLFGVQTNATLLDDATLDFLTTHQVSIGLSLDGPTAEINNRTRKGWQGPGTVHQSVLHAMERLRGYPGYSVIVTITRENVEMLSSVVELLHAHGVPGCLLNATRCTLPGAREVRVGDEELAGPFIRALERNDELFHQTGHKMVVANFANILLAILAPTARRLMCDISPCGGGRAFFALAANGDLFPCSEFIGLESFCGGNLFREGIDQAMASPAFATVTGRNVDRFNPCGRCAIRHYCGSPCPAEAHEMNGGMDQIGAFCHFYEEQVRYAFRLIADGRANDFLWQDWDAADGMETVIDFSGSITGSSLHMA
ncbi:MAG: peptide-modifying radical SAM enzyme CbpB [Magnetococcales bacterium]|nr:peptide-modifying radical SAM enzyme CbpB [Magnetococcales bacterium]MBF0150769.1 peptide-modifying radical SAM enzyme CbpB [Magnetococcales bacterium]MBF0630129.1 peptide-modifying radical SAM enzyme CbpB [Magnetococcales bacterium]